jgi:thiol-disulfide isomerase/thioredoxin
MSRLQNVFYLEDIDFDNNGNLVGFQKLKAPPKPAIVLTYANWCGHCKDFKKTYQEFANNLAKTKPVYVTAIEQDGNEPGQKAIAKMIKSGMFPKDFRGFPHIVMYDETGKVEGVKVYDGNRSLRSLIEFSGLN